MQENKIKFRNDREDKLERLLSNLGINYEDLNDQLFMDTVINDITKLNNTYINDCINNIIPFNEKFSFFNHQTKNKKIINFQNKEMNDVESKMKFDFHETFSLRSIQSEKFLGHKLYDGGNMFNVKPEIPKYINYSMYSIQATIEYENISINTKQFKKLFQLLKKMEDKTLNKLGYYYLITSGLFTPGLENFNSNLYNIEMLVNDKPVTDTFIFKILGIKYFNDDSECSGHPLWKTDIRKISNQTSIAQFSITDKGVLSNVFIEADYRSKRLNDGSVLEYIFNMAIMEAKKKFKNLFITTKNNKMLKKMKDFNFEILGATYPPQYYEGYTLPNEIVGALRLDDNTDDLQLAYINSLEPKLFLMLPKDEETNLVENILENLDGSSFKGYNNSYLRRNLLDTYNMKMVPQETALFNYKDKIVSIPFIKIDVPFYDITIDSSNLLNMDTLLWFKYDLGLDINVTENNIDIIYNDSDPLDIINEAITLQQKSFSKPIKRMLRLVDNMNIDPMELYLLKEFVEESGLINLDIFLNNIKNNQINGIVDYTIELDEIPNLSKIVFKFKDSLNGTLALKTLVLNAFKKYKEKTDWTKI